MTSDCRQSNDDQKKDEDFRTHIQIKKKTTQKKLKNQNKTKKKTKKQQNKNTSIHTVDSVELVHHFRNSST